MIQASAQAAPAANPTRRLTWLLCDMPVVDGPLAWIMYLLRLLVSLPARIPVGGYGVRTRARALSQTPSQRTR